jgi:pimeloyl-ACP methyl ester carboxylesterase
MALQSACAGSTPLLLLHGWPQTRKRWPAVAPALTDSFTVVVPDLRGYGRSAILENIPTCSAATCEHYNWDSIGRIMISANRSDQGRRTHSWEL